MGCRKEGHLRPVQFWKLSQVDTAWVSELLWLLSTGLGLGEGSLVAAPGGKMIRNRVCKSADTDNPETGNEVRSAWGKGSGPDVAGRLRD